MRRPRCADERRRDHGVAQHPLDRHLGERLPALLGDDVQPAQGRESPVAERSLRERSALLGAVAFTLLQELFQSEAVFGEFASHWQLTLGLTIIAFVAFLPRGLIGLVQRGAPR